MGGEGKGTFATDPLNSCLFLRCSRESNSNRVVWKGTQVKEDSTSAKKYVQSS